MDELFNLVRREADRVSSIKQTPRNGLITAYDKTTHSIRVTLQPEGVETGWLPLARHAVGNGFGAVFGPNLKDQVKLLPAESDGETHTVIGKFYNDVDKPPQVEAGEYLIQHQKGQKVFWDKDGNLTSQGSKNNKTVHDKDGNITTTSSGNAVTKTNADGSASQTGQSGSTVVVDPKGSAAGVNVQTPKNILHNAAQKVVLNGGGGGSGTSQDQAAKNAIKAKALADLNANPSAKSVNMSTTLPSGASYSYSVSRNG